jgi:hypothetical protein
MKFTKMAAIAITTLTTLSIIQTTQAALVVTEPNYFVRPALRVGFGELIDGITVNGDLQSTQDQGVVGYSSSEVDLSEGTVKMYSSESSLLQGLQTFGSFGERITITGGAGTNWDLSFAVEGMLNILGGGPVLDSEQPATLLYNVGIAVYQAGQVQWNNFVNNPNFDPLLFQFQETVDILDGSDSFSEMNVYEEVFGSVTLASDYEVFDIFAYTNMIVTPHTGNGIVEYEADFTNTARFGQTFANGAQGFSSSGSFMGLTTPPPAPTNNVTSPSIIALLGISLGVLLMRLPGRNVH